SFPESGSGYGRPRASAAASVLAQITAPRTNGTLGRVRAAWRNLLGQLLSTCPSAEGVSGPAGTRHPVAEKASCLPHLLDGALTGAGEARGSGSTRALLGACHLGNPPLRRNTEAKALTRGERIGSSQFCVSRRVASPMAFMAGYCDPYQRRRRIRAGRHCRGSDR